MMISIGKYIALTDDEYKAEVAARQAKRQRSRTSN
jgi:hypothetical protein